MNHVMQKVNERQQEADASRRSTRSKRLLHERAPCSVPSSGTLGAAVAIPAVEASVGDGVTSGSGSWVGATWVPSCVGRGVAGTTTASASSGAGAGSGTLGEAVPKACSTCTGSGDGAAGAAVRKKLSVSSGANDGKIGAAEGTALSAP